MCPLYLGVEMGVRSELCVGSLDCGHFSLKILLVAIVIVTIMWFLRSL